MRIMTFSQCIVSSDSVRKLQKAVQNLLIEQVDVYDQFTPKTEIIY